MSADKSLGQRIRAAAENVREKRKWKNAAKRRKDNASTPEEYERRLSILEKLRKALADALKRLKGLRERAANRKPKIVATPGSPHWGGSDDILRIEVEPIAAKRGLRPNSAKRTESYGNPGSDHHTSQVWASARDFPTANNYGLRDEISRKVVGRTTQDYESVYFTRAGRRYRYQAIAGTHGTGPHLHIGIRAA